MRPSPIALALFVSGSLFVLSACAWLPSIPDERLQGGWDGGQWVCSSVIANDLIATSQRLVKCAKGGEDLWGDNWTQSLHVQTLPRERTSVAAEALAASMREGLSEECRAVELNVIDLQAEPEGALEQSVLLEWVTCSSHYVVARSLYGKSKIFQITYQTRGERSRPSEERSGSNSSPKPRSSLIRDPGVVARSGGFLDAEASRSALPGSPARSLQHVSGDGDPSRRIPAMS